MRKFAQKSSLFLFFLLSILSIVSVKAEIKLPAIVSSNMVLQRNTDIVVWGWADANEKITIKTSWLDNLISIDADKDGNWRVEIKTTNSKEAQTIRLKSEKSDILLENILFGEVWLCSGQSNMEQPVKGFGAQPTFGSALAIAKSTNFNLRLFTVKRDGSKTPKKEVKDFDAWQQASSSNVAEFSAVGYFFGKQLQEILDCPVGLIHTSWGGSEIKAWMSKEVLSAYEDVNLENKDITKSTNHIATALYNAMIHPLIPYTIKGSIWYQGESDRKKPEVYKNLFPAMVKDWRTRWGIGEFPFYYVQIAPYKYDGNDFFQENNNTSFLREVQLESLKLIPNSGMATTMDIGLEQYIHPPYKKEVADRLLFNALHKTYGYTGVDYTFPIFKSLEVKDNSIFLSFENDKNGLYTFNELTGFEIAGNDKVFYPAIATIENRKSVMVKSDKVPNPVAVRYAWNNWVVGSLFNTNLIPASSFRTDTWTDATRAKE